MVLLFPLLFGSVVARQKALIGAHLPRQNHVDMCNGQRTLVLRAPCDLVTTHGAANQHVVGHAQNPLTVGSKMAINISQQTARHDRGPHTERRPWCTARKLCAPLAWHSGALRRSLGAQIHCPWRKLNDLRTCGDWCVRRENERERESECAQTRRFYGQELFPP